jgi:hypothetical protein
MYWYMDSYQPVVAAVVFVSFSLVGALFLLNLVVASIFLNFSTAQLTEQDGLRIRRERVAAIKAAEKAEQLRAVAKARLVAQVRHRALLTKVRLRRVSVAAERLALSPQALEAAAAADAMHAELDPEGEVPPAVPFGVDLSPGSSGEDAQRLARGLYAAGAAEPIETEADVFSGAQGPPQLHGVLRRRLAHTLSVRSMQARPVHLPSGVVVADDYVSTPSAATAAATPSVAATASAANATQSGTLSPGRLGRGGAAVGGLSALGSGVAAVMRTLSFAGAGSSTRNLVQATAATGVSGGSTTAGAIGIVDSSRSNRGGHTSARADTVHTYHTVTTAVHSPIAGGSSEAPVTPLSEDGSPLHAAPAVARPSPARGTSQRLVGVGEWGRGLGLMAPSGLRPRVPHLPPLGLGGGPPHRAPVLVQPPQDASVRDAAVGQSSAINYGFNPGLTALRGVSTRLLGPQGVSRPALRIAAAPAPAPQLPQQGVGQSGTAAAPAALSDDTSVVSGQTGVSDGFSGFFKRGGRGKGSGTASVTGSDALHTVTEGDDEGSVTSFSSMDTALAKSYIRRFAMPTRTPCGLRLRYYALEFATSGAFNLLMVLLIVLNMVTMSMDAYPVDATLTHRLDVLNALLTLVFAVEMSLRIFALGLRAYVRDRINLFDVLVVLLSLIDLAISPPYLWTGVEAQSTSVLALRTLRLTRVFKLARSWTSLRVLIKTIFSAAKDVMYFGVLLLLYMFIFSLLGIQLFANRWRFDPADGSLLTPHQSLYYDNNVIVPRSNYDNLWSAMLSTMQLLTFENWTVSWTLPWRDRVFSTWQFRSITYCCGGSLALILGRV